MSRFNSYLAGLLAGLIGTPISLIVVYLVGCVAITVSTLDFFTVILSALTVLPLMVLLVLAAPTLVVCVLEGLTLAATSRFDARYYVPGTLAFGVALSFVVLSLILPRIIVPHPPDFVSIISKPLLSLSFGVITAGNTTWVFRRLNNWLN